ncbi:GNAT family N-acetyltransferase [Bacillus sp. V59.32b]|uniref:GNAT family N-acetyltransferase n=1 Tax=Bacillus sp. V59.32b TaxID=1758642 RepID=UPI0020B1705E|nr:GNAT family N-acetyltransferase [Bacillus sp. V59.32b]
MVPHAFKESDFKTIKETFKNLVNNEAFIFLLLEDHQKAIGYAWIEMRNYPENAFRKLYKSVFVHQISLVETERKKGYGTKLMDHIDKIAKCNDIDLIELNYWINNDIAKAFYKKHGYSKHREFVYKNL